MSSSSNTPTFQDYVTAARQTLRGHSSRDKQIAVGVVGAIVIAVLVGLLISSLTSSSTQVSEASATADIADPLVVLAPSDGRNGSALVLVSGKPVFPLPGSGVLSYSVGAPVEVQDAKIQEIVTNDGFWIGTNYEQRIFVHVPQSALNKGALSPATLQENQLINVSGRIQLAPEEPAALGLKDLNATQLQTQTQFVEANSVRPAN